MSISPDKINRVWPEEGLEKWFGRLFESYNDSLFSYVAGLMRDREAASDVMQNLFVRIVHNPAPFCRVSQLRPYLFAAARKEALRYMAKISRTDTLEKKMDYTLLMNKKDVSTGGPEPCMETDRINRALMQLPAEQYEAVILKTYQGLTYDEMSQVLGRPAPTCQSRYRAALKNLKEKLAHG
ncbi:RNA polymerase sigma factor [Planctomycetota bacterium]